MDETRRTRRGLIRAFFAALALAGAVQAGARAQESPAPPAEAEQALGLERALAELRSVRDDRHRLETGHEAEMRSLEIRLQELEAGNSALKSRLEILESANRGASAALSAAGMEISRREAAAREAAAALDLGAARLKDTVSASLPFRKSERLKAFDEAIAAQAPRAPAEDAAPRSDALPSRMRRLQAVLDSEIALGSSSEAFLDRVELGPADKPRARCLRVGMVVMAFLTEDGGRSGLLVRDPGSGSFRWMTELSFRQRWGLKRGLEILERRRPPVFLDFPADLGLIGPAGTGTASPKKEVR